VNLSPVTRALVPPCVRDRDINNTGAWTGDLDGYFGVGNNNQAGSRRSPELNSRCSGKPGAGDGDQGTTGLWVRCSVRP